MLWKLILSSMLLLQPPGQSPYSLVKVEKDTPVPCHEPTILCDKPRWSSAHNSYVAVENWEQGLHRYQTIAKAIQQVTEEREWSFPRGQLWRYLVAVAYHESGFRKDIHSGIGSAAKGDCMWTFKNGKPHKRIPGTCRSNCLTQILFAGRDKVKGFSKKEIVGTDLKSTKKCFTITALAMDSFYERCSGNAKCMFMSYGGVKGLGNPKVKKRIEGRVASFFKIKRSKPLDIKVLELLK